MTSTSLPNRVADAEHDRTASDHARAGGLTFTHCCIMWNTDTRLYDLDQDENRIAVVTGFYIM
jgi:hypothetical protein